METTSQQDHPRAIGTLIRDSHEVIFRASSYFPLDLVPDRLIIDVNKITIISRELLGMETEHTVLLDEVRDVDVTVNYFLGTLSILGTSNGPGSGWTLITNLRKQDAYRAKAIIEGLLIARREQCDLSDLKPEELVRMVIAIGSREQ